MRCAVPTSFLPRASNAEKLARPGDCEALSAAHKRNGANQRKGIWMEAGPPLDYFERCVRELV
jgi:hypothetical protein